MLMVEHNNHFHIGLAFFGSIIIQNVYKPNVFSAQGASQVRLHGAVIVHNALCAEIMGAVQFNCVFEAFMANGAILF